jgi:N-acetylmuramoyl-L-alanine amidase
MRPTAQRLLNVLVSAGVSALMAILSAPLQPAVAANGDTPPAPYIVALDPGHGGTADDSHPERLFDPGVTAKNGLLEKDLTLDATRRLRKLLQDERVKVVMTRDSDVFKSIGDRAQVANDAHADLFVSIHFNYFDDPSVGGSLVLYPNERSHPFATIMASVFEEKLKPLGIGGNGVMSKPDLWTRTEMPTVTLEAAYLTNPREADKLTHASTLDGIAGAADAGILQQAPEIAQRKAEITAYEKAHAAKPVAVTAPSSFPWPSLAFAAIALGLAVFYRRRVLPVAAVGLRVVLALLAGIAQLLVALLAAILAATGHTLQPARAPKPEWRNRRGVRRRRSRARPWPTRARVRVRA